MVNAAHFIRRMEELLNEIPEVYNEKSRLISKTSQKLYAPDSEYNELRDLMIRKEMPLLETIKMDLQYYKDNKQYIQRVLERAQRMNVLQKPIFSDLNKLFIVIDNMNKYFQGGILNRKKDVIANLRTQISAVDKRKMILFNDAVKSQVSLFQEMQIELDKVSATFSEEEMAIYRLQRQYAGIIDGGVVEGAEIIHDEFQTATSMRIDDFSMGSGVMGNFGGFLTNAVATLLIFINVFIVVPPVLATVTQTEHSKKVEQVIQAISKEFQQMVSNIQYEYASSELDAQQINKFRSGFKKRLNEIYNEFQKTGADISFEEFLPLLVVHVNLTAATSFDGKTNNYDNPGLSQDRLNAGKGVLISVCQEFGLKYQIDSESIEVEKLNDEDREKLERLMQKVNAVGGNFKSLPEFVDKYNDNDTYYKKRTDQNFRKQVMKILKPYRVCIIDTQIEVVYTPVVAMVQQHVPPAVIIAHDTQPWEQKVTKIRPQNRRLERTGVKKRQDRLGVIHGGRLN